MHHPSKNAHRRRRVLLALGSLLLLLAGAAFASAQDAAATPQELRVSDIMKLPGKLLGESNSTRAVGQFKVQNYRVEEVDLPQATTVEVAGRNVEVTKAYRVSVTGGPFPVRALPPVVWVGDVAIGYGVESEDLTSITAVTFDRSLLAEGATVYLSYGDKETKTDRTPLPEKLSLGGAKGGQQ